MGHWDFIKNIINNRGADNMILLSIILCTFLLIIVFEKGVKVIDVYFPSADGCAKKELKLKINNSGVFSIILASSVMHFPEMIKNYLKYNQISFEPLNNFFNLFSKQSNWYYFIYGTLVFIFTYNQSEINLNAEDINNQLQDHNLLIDKRQGEESIEYLDDTIFYLKIISACYVTLICILPDYLLNYLGYNMEFSGTSILVLSNICQLIFHGTLDHNYKEQIGKFIPSFLKK